MNEEFNAATALVRPSRRPSRPWARRSSQLASLTQAEAQADATLRARREASRVLQTRLETGLASRSQWLSERRRETQARLAALEVRGQRLQVQAALLRALGSPQTAS